MEKLLCLLKKAFLIVDIRKNNSYKDMLFQIAFSYLGNKYDCEDVTIGNGHLMIEFVGFDVSTTNGLTLGWFSICT